MEDRYLFKAKRADNGEWEIGSLIALPTGEYEISNKCNNPPDCDPMWDKVVITHKVEPSTICQCTGLKDKNGNLIWENDVVKATVRQNSLCQSSSYSDFYQISYQEKYCYFYLKKKNNNLLFDGNWSYYLKSIEVIGNIFDNPELLESEG